MSKPLEWRDLSLLVVLLALGVFFGLLAPQYLSARNLSMLTIEFAITSVLSLGMLLVILPGHIDLSAGSGVGLIGGVAAVLIMRYEVPAELAMLAAIALALLLWRAQGFVIWSQGIPAFIITLGGLLACKGLFWLTIRNQTVPVSPGGQSNLLSVLTTTYLPPVPSYLLGAVVIGLLGLSALRSHRRACQEAAVQAKTPPDGELAFLRWLLAAQALALVVLTCGQFRGLPLPLLILATVAVVVQVVTQHTRLGRALYAIGGNEEAAVLSGIPVGKVVVTAYTLLGGLVALTGLLQTAYAGASTTTVGELMELDAVAACVIGGCSLRGGRGSVAGVLLGSLVMASLLSGMSLLAVPPEARFIARGLVLGLAAWLDVRLSKLSRGSLA
ncbi:MAG: ATPase [Deltaproteobacteria bacterium]|jgi:D-xylose transport system permease protein|nr:ATPase [Deltaproteobacteria bacterium]